MLDTTCNFVFERGENSYVFIFKKGLHLFADTHYLSGTYSVVIIGYLAVILLPVVIIGLTIFLHCLEKELEIESCSVNRRITELDKKLESLK